MIEKLQLLYQQWPYIWTERVDDGGRGGHSDHTLIKLFRDCHTTKQKIQTVDIKRKTEIQDMKYKVKSLITEQPYSSFPNEISTSRKAFFCHFIYC